MKSLIISDIHNRWDVAKRIVDKIKDADKIIFLGDLLDNRNENKDDVIKTCEWLAEMLDDPRFIWCVGNHDIWYIYPIAGYLACSGNTAEKGKIFREILGNKRFLGRLYYNDDYFLYSHAGLHSFFVPPQGFSYEWLDRKCKEAIEDTKAGIPHPFLLAGADRGGRQKVGGITWCDFDAFIPIKGVNQIVGHSRGYFPNQKLDENSVNWCLDTNNFHYGQVDDGKLIVRDTFIL